MDPAISVARVTGFNRYQQTLVTPVMPTRFPADRTLVTRDIGVFVSSRRNQRPPDQSANPGLFG
jgi:hypothetical protein